METKFKYSDTNIYEPSILSRSDIKSIMPGYNIPPTKRKSATGSRSKKVDYGSIASINEQLEVFKDNPIKVAELERLKKETLSVGTTELAVHNQVCKYIKLQYPNVMFLSDFGAGIKLTQGMAQRQKMQKSDHSFPDLMIFEPRGAYHGLFLELKRDRDALYNKNGLMKPSPHIIDQIYCLDELKNRGYFTNFACGFDEAKKIIDDYMRADLPVAPELKYFRF